MDQVKRRKSPKLTPNSKKITVRVPPELDARLYELATRRQLGISEMFATVLLSGLDVLEANHHHT